MCVWGSISLRFCRVKLSQKPIQWLLVKLCRNIYPNSSMNWVWGSWVKGHCHFGLKVFSCLSVQNSRNIWKDFFFFKFRKNSQLGLKDELNDSSWRTSWGQRSLHEGLPSITRVTRTVFLYLYSLYKQVASQNSNKTATYIIVYFLTSRKLDL